MRSKFGAVGIVLLALLGASCDTTQPLTLESQTFELKMLSTGGMVRLLNVYTGFQDDDNDNQPDAGTSTFNFCRWRMVGGTPEMRGPTSAPFGFTVEITILRAGATEPERIVSDAAVTDSDSSVAQYDATTTILGQVPPQAPIALGGHTFKFINGRIRTEAFEAVMASTANPLTVLDPGTYGQKGSGLCSVYYPGPPVVDRPSGTAYPYRIVLGKGDTVTVGARRAVDPPPGFLPSIAPQYALTSLFTLQGVSVDVRGEKSSAPGPGQGFTFSYTTR